VLDDPGGLNAAADAAAAHAARLGVPWLIAHGDLPLLGAGELRAALGALASGEAVLAPSRHGGTNLLGAGEPIVFRYGVGSFSRHLAATRHLRQRVLVSTATLLDLDTPSDLAAAVSHPRGAWLGEFLT
jgi:2-phospho-L-lactate guanylyltransferase (CobY/MobA/RfbA family)